MRVTLISITPLNKHFHESTNWNKYSIFLHQCWRKDYLLEFRSTRIGNKTEESNIKMNDIATVLDENQNRNKWRLGKIEKLVAGKGGIIRRRAKQETHSYNRTPPEAFLPRMKENEKRPSSNTRMKKTDETNDELSKQIQED